MIAKYTYDDLGQLTREDNKARNKSYKYTYDTAGNIEKRETYNYTTGTLGTPTKTDNYTYGNAAWGDLLTAYNGVSFTYDEIGNPLTYYNGQSYSFTWAQGRRLISSTSANNELTYTYNDEGIRTSKTINGTTHYYTLDGTKILTETWGNNLLVYIYDETGSPIGMRYRRSTYADDVFDDFLFEKNLQGDIVAVYNESGTKIVSYTYDAYGKVIQTVTSGYSSSPAKYNPFRYRGYYYDENTGFYYLNSRYYDPNIGRFISPEPNIYQGGFDVGSGLFGFNAYSYCANNPIMFYDCSGEFRLPYALKNLVVATVTVVVVAVVIYIAVEMPSKEEHYDRNENNIDFPDVYDEDFFNDDEWTDDVSANCHQFSAPNRDNVKYVSLDGRYEVIYDCNGQRVDDPRDVGTYNFASPTKRPIAHFVKDVLPWIIHGNSPQDTTKWHQRAFSFVGVYY